MCIRDRCKHLLKYNVTRMSEVLLRAQPYIQLGEAMKTSFNHTVKHDDVGGKLKSPHEASTHAQDWNHGQPSFKRQELPILSPNSLQSHKLIGHHFTPPRSPSARSSTPSRTSHMLGARDRFGMIFHFLEQKNIAPIMIARDTRPLTVGPSESIWKS